jgi:endonuclease YncB( thermonuclease family)
MARIGEFGGRRRRGFRRGRRRGGAVAVFIAAFLLAAFFFAGPLTGEWTSPPLSPDPPAKLADTHTDFSGRVTRIVDGDTFYVEGAPVRIRLWGLDAPERREDGYDEATAALRRISPAASSAARPSTATAMAASSRAVISPPATTLPP